jgi:hypothetical protein
MAEKALSQVRNNSPVKAILNPGSNQDYNLPDTVPQFTEYHVINQSNTYTVTVKSSVGNTIAVLKGSDLLLVAVQGNPTTAAHWQSQSPLDPALMSDALATKLGLRQYVEGVDAGVTTNTTTGVWNFTRCVFMPYQTNDGTWRLRFNIVGSTTTTALIRTVTINGITFKNVANYYPAVTVAVEDPDSGDWKALAVFNTNGINARGTVVKDQIRLSGDLELESKPSWAH